MFVTQNQMGNGLENDDDSRCRWKVTKKKNIEEHPSHHSH